MELESDRMRRLKVCGFIRSGRAKALFASREPAVAAGAGKGSNAAPESVWFYL